MHGLLSCGSTSIGQGVSTRCRLCESDRTPGGGRLKRRYEQVVYARGGCSMRRPQGQTASQQILVAKSLGALSHTPYTASAAQAARVRVANRAELAVVRKCKLRWVSQARTCLQETSPFPFIPTGSAVLIATWRGLAGVKSLLPDARPYAWRRSADTPHEADNVIQRRRLSSPMFYGFRRALLRLISRLLRPILRGRALRSQDERDRRTGCAMPLRHRHDTPAPHPAKPYMPSAACEYSSR